MSRMELRLGVEFRPKKVRMKRSRMVRYMKDMKQTISFKQSGQSKLLLRVLPIGCDQSLL